MPKGSRRAGQGSHHVLKTNFESEKDLSEVWKIRAEVLEARMLNV